MLFGEKDAGEIFNESYLIKYRKMNCGFGCTLHVGTKSVYIDFKRKTKTPDAGHGGILLHKQGKLTI